ncbi:DUF6438 domain-containing protein [Methylomonas fluvii]|uniref:DUF6438 domain-containing protein n=1 Tax=Methylomonas fluvii TaxID=1854564 RepID=A0ABR9D7U1_9GAMM|nr:DUF6438 domain-containing protein [Methylomonas fluvii]MBD9359174.1 hypothetical protein [Methylomonas fluvii]CAD6871856.1 hypothetical protein [Methylomonas fluvii]
MASAKNSRPIITLQTYCPSCTCAYEYKIEIFSTGNVHWQGKHYVHIKGDRYKNIEKIKIKDLIAKFDEVGFFDRPDDYSEEMKKKHLTWTDMSYMKITFNSGEKNKSVIYGRALFELEGAIKDAVTAESWLNPAPDPWESGCIEDRR